MPDGFVHPEYLVSTEWLAGHLYDPAMVVFDCTTHLVPDPKVTYQVVPGRADFEQAHIPGAQFVDVQADLSDTSHRFRFMQPTGEVFATAMRRFGVSDESRVVLYSTANVWWATRVWWLLRLFGHDKAAVLDGGFQAWRREGRPVETGAARFRAPGRFSVRAARDWMADKAAVRAAIGDAGTCTINALTPQQHAGTGGNVYGRPGHIAGSVNVPAAHLVDPATNKFWPADALRAVFTKVGAMDKPVITYCGGGIAASADALALIMLGHRDVRLYDASLSEWAIDPGLPMEVGE